MKKYILLLGLSVNFISTMEFSQLSEADKQRIKEADELYAQEHRVTEHEKQMIQELYVNMNIAIKKVPSLSSKLIASYYVDYQNVRGYYRDFVQHKKEGDAPALIPFIASTHRIERHS